MTIVNTPHRPSSARVTRTRVIGSALLAGSLVVGLGACGDDTEDATPLDTVPPPSDTAPTTTPPTTGAPADTAPSNGIEHPVGADEVVLRIAYEGGFVPVDVAFQNLPAVLVTGDGRLITQGPQIAIYPGPLLPNMQVRTISDAGIQELLQLAAEHGLLTEREYENPTNIADAPDTVVTIAANGEVYEHRAYALGLGGGPDGGETSEPREALASFVEEVTGTWMFEENPELGAEQPYPTDTYLVRAIAVDDLSGFEIEPTVVDWPAELPPLAEATECLAIPAAEVGDLFAEADQLTFFTSVDVTYQLAVKPELPGTGC
jgi:hypothetical protein